MRCAGSRHPLAETNPLRSMPFSRPWAAVYGPGPLEAAQMKLQRLKTFLPSLSEGLAYAYECLGKANRMPKVTRRRWQGNVMRNINHARAQVRRLFKDIAAAEADLRALAH